MNVNTIITYLKNPRLLLLRIGVNSFLKLMDDENYLKLSYRIRMKKKLNLENPSTFNEKIQWLKLHDRKPIYTELADKYEVKKHIASLIGEEHIIPTLGVWNDFDEIDFEQLPNQFVLKCTHDSGGLSICRNKKEFEKDKVRKKIRKGMKRNYYWSGREWPYKDIKPKVIAEKYMVDGTRHDLRDYKFFCFSGVPKILYISEGLEDHSTARISFYDLEGNQMPFQRKDYKPMESLDVPNNFDEMVKIATQIAMSINIPFVRIDLYSIQNEIYFSEVTFSPCSGMLPFEPIEWDKELGSWIEL